MPADATTPRTNPLDAPAAMLPTRKSFALLFKIAIAVVLPLTVVVIGCTLCLILFRTTDATETALYIRLMQISLGMILGTASLVFGVLLSWLGIEEAFAFSGEAGN